jgi:hypothetical protein
MTRSGRSLPEWKEFSYSSAADDLPGANGRFQNKLTKNKINNESCNKPSLFE